MAAAPRPGLPELQDRLTGLVFDIQAHSVHDGPGTRTTVFLNGCPLSCEWCCNPEGLHRQPVLLHREVRCIGCGQCVQACGQGAVTLGPAGLPVFDRARCAVCAAPVCVEQCYHEGLALSGKRYGVEQLVALLQRDRPYWGSRGGVTFSGGEPLYQKDFILALLGRCRELGIHVCLETTACVAPDHFMAAAALADWLFVDLKHLDPEAHRRRTGSDNRLILENLQRFGASDLASFGVVRIPVIPHWNDSEANLRASARFVRGCGLEVINLLPFHRLGESKWRQLGRDYPFAQQPGVGLGELAQAAQWIREEGLVCYVGWETPF